MIESCKAGWTDKILISTDGSKFSEGAVRQAIKLAKKCSGKLMAMTVVETNQEYAAIAPELVEKAERAARAVLEKIKDQAKREGLDCDIVVREGEETFKYIIDEAVKNKCTMIVTGRRGRTGLTRLMMGSVTARVIGYSPCNVLIVPSASEQEFKNILIATDGSKYSVRAAGEAICLAKRSSGSITVISVVPVEQGSHDNLDLTVKQREKLDNTAEAVAEKFTREVREAAQKEGVPAKAFVASGKPADIIIQMAQETNADLIVMGSHGRAGVDKLLMGSVAERVIVTSECPVLVVKSK
ncbi:MAG TPA: universal stress protein [Nitrospirota bacterium]|nr:universal stress protein [Nitrospirota bacterium]